MIFGQKLESFFPFFFPDFWSKISTFFPFFQLNSPEKGVLSGSSKKTIHFKPEKPRFQKVENLAFFLKG